MIHWKFLALTLLMGCGLAVTLAAPAPDEAKPTLITAANVKQLKSIQEVKQTVDRISRTSNADELLFLHRGRSVVIVKPSTLETVRPLLKGHAPTDIAISRDGKMLAWAGGGDTYTIQGEDGKTFTIKIGQHCGDAAFSPDNKIIAIGSTYWKPDEEGAGHSEMMLFDAQGKLIRTLGRGGPGALRPVFSPDGKTLAVSNRNHEVRLLDVASGKLLHALEKRMTQEIAFSPDGKTLAAGYVDGTLRVWDVAEGKLLHSQKTSCSELYSVDWSPKGDILAASGRDGKITLWGAGTWEQLRELDSPSWVIQVRFSADGTRLLTSGAADDTGKREHKVVVWGVPDARQP